LDALLEFEELNIFEIDASIYDCGNKQGFFISYLAVGMRDSFTRRYVEGFFKINSDS